MNENFGFSGSAKWHHIYYCLTGKKRLDFISEELYFVFIEPTLNNDTLRKAYSDKNAYQLFFDKKYLPKTLFRIINNSFYNDENVLIEKEKAFHELSLIKENIVLKPAIESGGGKNIIIAQGSTIAKYIEKNPMYAKESFLIQELVEQHEDLKKFNPNSLNTLRIMTARVNNEVKVLSAYLRMGRKNQLIDNGMAGGLTCGVLPDGKLMKTGLDKYLNTSTIHPDSKIEFDGFEVPGYQNTADFCTSHHKKFLHFTFISWDIGISPDCTPVFY